MLTVSVSLHPAITQVPHASAVDSSAAFYDNARKIDLHIHKLMANAMTTVSLPHTHHDIWTSHTLESIVHPSTCLLYQNLLDGLGMIFGVDAFSGSKHYGFFKFIRVYVNTDDPVCPGGLATHDSSQSYSSETKHGTRGTLFNLSAHRAFIQEIMYLHHSEHVEVLLVQYSNTDWSKAICCIYMEAL